MSDWTVRGQDLDQRFAKFGRTHLTDGEVWALSLASIVCPDSDLAYKLYLTSRAGVIYWAEDIRGWSADAAESLLDVRRQTTNGKTRAFIETDSVAWVRRAGIDGAAIALFGEIVPSLGERAREFGVSRPTYAKVREFVAGVVSQHIDEFRHALAWACGYVPNRAYDARVDGLKITDFDLDAISIVGAGHSGVSVPSGCYIKPRLSSSSGDVDDDAPNEYQNPGFRDRGFWSDREAHKIRVEGCEPRPANGAEIPVGHETRRGGE